MAISNMLPVNTSGLQLIKAQTVGTTVSSVTVTDAFNTSFDNYRITYTGGTGSTDGELQLKFGSATTGYYQNVIYTAWNSTTVLAVVVTNGSQMTYAGVLAADGNHLEMNIFNPFTSRRTGISGHFVGFGAGRVGGHQAGFMADTNSYNSFIIQTSTGTMTGGTIRVYGYRN
jgi:hypothetical protein